MQLRQSLQNSTKGFGLIELMVASLLGLVVGGIILSSVTAQGRLFKGDIARTRANENLRGLTDIVAAQLRLVGENLPGNFPAIELVDGANGAPDTLTIRRNLLDEVLKLCRTLPNGSTQTNVDFSFSSSVSNPSPSGCGYNVNTGTYSSWNNEWVRLGSGTVGAFMYHPSNKTGEFFDFDLVSDTGSIYRLIRSDSGSWGQTYNVNNGWIYFLEEWEVSLTNGNVLELTDWHNAGHILNIAYNISDFQVEIEMQDNSIKTNFTTSDDWTQIKNIAVTLDSTESVSGDSIQRSWTTKVFPRNILSSYE